MRIYQEENVFQFSNVVHHPINYDYSVFVTSEYSWLPYRLLINLFRKKSLERSNKTKFYAISPYGIHLVDTSGNLIESPISKGIYLFKVILSLSFWSKLFLIFLRTFAISLNYKKSLQLGKITIGGIKVGDIVAAEYLRDSRFGNGCLKFDIRFYTVLVKYLIVYILFNKEIKRLLKLYSREEIRFAIQETSFKDEMRRRMLIQNGIVFEYQYNKFNGKMSLIEYLIPTEGRIHDFTPYTSDVSNCEIKEVAFALNSRLNEGVQSWTLNINDVKPNVNFIYPSNFNNKNPTAVVFLHAVADDQYRCGLDDFTSLDSFHRFTISKLLSLGYQCIIKSHPSVISPLHPDKTGIDNRYLVRLFKDYGLNYTNLLESEINVCQSSKKYKNLIALHPKLSIQSLASKTSFLVVTHHGNITFEALHLGLPAIKYRYCKNRAYSFCNDWATKEQYVHLLEYFMVHKRLPTGIFRDSYLNVAAVLARKSKNIDYNKLLIKISIEAGLPLKEKPASLFELNENFKMIKNRMKVDLSFAEVISKHFDNFLI